MKPLSASPARAASIAALTANSFVLSAISVMIDRNDPISFDAVATDCMDSAALSARSEAARA